MSLAIARGLDEEGYLNALLEERPLADLSEAQLYAAMDWLYLQQTQIEQQLASQHLQTAA